MKKFFTLAAAMFAAVSFASAQDACYVLGEVNGGGWDAATPSATMEQVSDGVFTATVDVDGYFGLVWELGDWDIANAARLYPADGEQMISMDGTKAVVALSTDKAGGDAFTLGTPMTGVKLTVDYNEMTLTVETESAPVLDPRIFLIGDISLWGFDETYVLTETTPGIHEIKDLTLSGAFKLANQGWAPNNVGAAYDEEGIATWPMLGEPYTAFNDGGSGNLVINNEAEQTFTVDIKLDMTGDAPIVTINAAGDGVENVAVDANAPATYYNLQGVKVANPENGLYIVRRGNTATKVLVK